MNNSQGHNVTEDLLTKYFAREVTEEEAKAVEAWVALSAANQRQFEASKIIWADTGRIGNYEQVSVDVDEAFARVATRKNELLLQKRATSPVNMLWILRVAAVAIIGITISFWFLSRNEERMVLAADKELFLADLPDGSKVSVNAGSEVEIQSYRSSRSLHLTGEAYFEVVSNPEKPFVVSTRNIQVRVLGTVFGISEHSGHTIVSVEEGRVEVSYQNQQIILGAGKTGRFDWNKEELSTLEAKDTGEYRFWKTKSLAFRGLPLVNVVETLNKVYQANIQLKKPALEGCMLSVSFEDESLENILQIIGITLNLTITTEGDEIILDGEGC